MMTQEQVDLELQEIMFYMKKYKGNKRATHSTYGEIWITTYDSDSITFHPIASRDTEFAIIKPSLAFMRNFNSKLLGYSSPVRTVIFNHYDNSWENQDE